ARADRARRPAAGRGAGGHGGRARTGRVRGRARARRGGRVRRLEPSPSAGGGPRGRLPGSVWRGGAAMTTMTYAAAIREALAEELEREDEVFLLGEDIGESGGGFGGAQGLVGRVGPGRVLDTPSSGEGLVGAGVGASLLGGRPVVEIMFSDFAALAMDMIANQAAKTHYMTGGRLTVPLTLRLVTGTAGATAAQHSQSLEAWFAHVPGLKCV